MRVHSAHCFNVWNLEDKMRIWFDVYFNQQNIQFVVTSAKRSYSRKRGHRMRILLKNLRARNFYYSDKTGLWYIVHVQWRTVQCRVICLYGSSDQFYTLQVRINISYPGVHPWSVVCSWLHGHLTEPYGSVFFDYWTSTLLTLCPGLLLDISPPAYKSTSDLRPKLLKISENNFLPAIKNNLVETGEFMYAGFIYFLGEFYLFGHILLIL